MKYNIDSIDISQIADSFEFLGLGYVTPSNWTRHVQILSGHGINPRPNAQHHIC